MTASDGRRQLERRAGELAQRPAQETAVAAIHVVTVLVGSRRYALEVRHVARILRTDRLCRLPEDGSKLTGLAMAGGAAVPVADLASVLMSRAPDRARPVVVLIGDGDRRLGLLVDEVESFGEVVEMAPSVTSPAADQVGSDRTDPSTPVERGVTAEGVVLLDAEALLSHPGTVAARTGRPVVPHRSPLAPPAHRSQENS